MTESLCQHCGTALSALPGKGQPDSPGICPACLLGLGLERQTPTEDWNQDSIAEGPRFAERDSTTEPFPDRVPDVEQLVKYFPQLEIQHLIGYGGMGAVYQARQPNLDRTVALKILSPRLSGNPAFTKRFLREARTLAKLAHPNIVMVFDFGQAGPLHYLILEFVDGINLRDAMLEAKLTTKEALAVVPQVCDALQYAHDEGIVHRDIKPENILIDKKGRVKIADFGLAKLVQPKPEDHRLTGTRQVLGTLNYMAPEQVEGRGNIDHRADIYSLGVVFYELLTGELPLGRFDPPSAKNSVDARLDQVVLRTLEKEPQRRFQQASEVKSAMQGLSVVEAEALPNSPAPAWAAVGNSVPPLSPPPEIPTPQPEPKPAAAGPANAWQAAAFSPPGGAVPRAANVLAVPFTIDNVTWGFATARGILQLDKEGVVAEFEICDDIFGTIKSKPRTVRIPYSKIASVKYQAGMMNDKLILQTTSVTATAEIPESRAGSCELVIKKINRDEAGQWVVRLQQEIGQHPPTPQPANQVLSSSAASSLTGLLNKAADFFTALPIKPAHRPINPLRIASRFSTIRFWFVTCGILNFVFMSGEMRRMTRDFLLSVLHTPESTRVASWVDWLASISSVANPLAVEFGQTWFIPNLVFSISLFVAADKMENLKGYSLVALVCFAALIPFYPAYLLCAPWALIGLLILLLPSTIATFDFVDDDGKVHAPGTVGKGNKVPSDELWLTKPVTYMLRFLLTALLLGSAIGTVAIARWVTVASGTPPHSTQIEFDDAPQPMDEEAVTSSENSSENNSADGDSAEDDQDDENDAEADDDGDQTGPIGGTNWGDQ